jgi:hypothetical protein
MHMKRAVFVVGAIATLTAGVAVSDELPCTVCAGVRVGNPLKTVGDLTSGPQLEENDSLFVVWDARLDGTAESDVIFSLRSAGVTPWIRAVFRTPWPIVDNLEMLEAELEELVAIVENGGEGAFVQAVWNPDGGISNPAEHAYLLKKAAVAVTGAVDSARFIAGPIDPDPESIAALYAEEIAAYVDLLALSPGDDLRAAVAALTETDPGKPLVLDGIPWPETAVSAIARVAEAASAGFTVTLFDARSSTSIDLVPLKLLAQEFRGDLVFDPSAITGARAQAWAFVREDLGVRVVAEAAAGASELSLTLADPQLRAAVLVDPATGDEQPLSNTHRTAAGLEITVDQPGVAVLLRFERPSAGELAGFDEYVDVSGGRQVRVEEILRRLQAFEDDQARRLDHFQATRTLHLRFQSLEGAFEATYSGAFFSRRGGDFDWVWQDFSVGGVRWRSKRLPKVPLIQPEKVASLPADIRLEKDYDYRLRGTAMVDGRDCWVIDFKPVVADTGRSLYRGTVWVDQELFARVRTRAAQVGLEGSVLSNEETWFFEPVDAAGAAAPWSSESFVLPLRTSGQQTLSILSAVLPVEVEAVLEDVRINGVGFEADREAALASDATMLRDTGDGLRYLRKEKDGARVVESELDSDRLFLVGGLLWDETFDYPIPLAGVNYLNLDIKETGAQADVFFAGAFVAAGVADPGLFESRFNGGANVNGLFVKGTDELYREGEVVPEEAVKRRTASADIFVGRPFAGYLSFEVGYRARMEDFSRADDTAEIFVLPQDTMTHSLKGNIQYNRAGYRFGLFGDTNRRSDWEFWGLPENDEYDPDQRDYTRWRVNFTKTWWLPKFRKITLSLEHLDGDNLDRFSGYDFGLFGDATVAGYPSGLVRAESANGVHLTAGINYLELIRFELRADAVWVNNETTGLENELLSGFGVGGTITLPWQLIVSFEAGYAVAGPGKGDVALRVFFLRLFP